MKILPPLLFVGISLFCLAEEKTEVWFNPVTKKYERVVVEGSDAPSTKAGGTSNSKTKPSAAQPPDNGIPSSVKDAFKLVYQDTTGSEWRTYESKEFAQVVSFNPYTSELWYNPVKKKYQPVVRESELPPSERSQPKQRTDVVWDDKANKFTKIQVANKKAAPAPPKAYLDLAMRAVAYANKPAKATGWRCNLSNTVHSTPDDCQNPYLGGVWVTN